MILYFLCLVDNIMSLLNFDSKVFYILDIHFFFYFTSFSFEMTLIDLLIFQIFLLFFKKLLFVHSVWATCSWADLLMILLYLVIIIKFLFVFLVWVFSFSIGVWSLILKLNDRLFNFKVFLILNKHLLFLCLLFF